MTTLQDPLIMADMDNDGDRNEDQAIDQAVEAVTETDEGPVLRDVLVPILGGLARDLTHEVRKSSPIRILILKAKARTSPRKVDKSSRTRKRSRATLLRIKM